MGSDSVSAEAPWRRPGFDRAYWLRTCHGFAVYDSKGRLGVVEEVLYGGRSSELPERLLVRTGLFGRRRLEIPVTEIVEVIPRQTRIALANSRFRS